MIRIRLAVPAHTAGLVERSRLIARLDVLRDHVVTLVHAPAGFGKTTLMAQWKEALDRKGQRTNWLSIDPIDSSPESIREYLAEMAGCSAPSFDAICNALSDSDVARFLFIDDADTLPEPSLKLLFDIIQRMPPHVHFVLSSRRKLDVKLGRLRSEKRLAEFDARSIAFDRQEAGLLLSQLEKREQADTIWHMAGWPSGLDLAARRYSECSQPLTGRSPEVAEFLAEEVLDRQSPKIRKFLFETWVLPALSAPLCDAVCGIEDSAAILPALLRAGVYITPIDNDQSEWHYTPFFREFLGSRSDVCQNRQVELRKRAAQWYVDHGDVPQALEQLYQAGAIDDYADVLEANCEALTYEGRIFAIEKFAKRLPQEKLAKLPRVTLALVWLRTREMRYKAAERLLDAVTEQFDCRPGDDVPSVGSLRLYVAHRRICLSTARDELDDVGERSARLIEKLADEEPDLSCSLYSQMIYAKCDQFRFAEINQLEPRMRGLLEVSATPFAAIGVLASLGIGQFAAGRTQDAARALTQSYEAETPQRGIGRMDGIKALAALPLAELSYEWNERDKASELIRNFLPVARNFCYPHQLIVGHVTSSRLSQSHDDDESALATLDEGMRLAWGLGLERFRLSMVSEKVNILVRTGQLGEALSLAQSEGISLDDNLRGPSSASRTNEELRAAIWTRLAQSHDRANEAIAIAKQWRNFCSARGNVKSLIRWNITLARLYCVSGDPMAAQRSIHDAVVAAAPGRFIRSFVDEGVLIQRLLLDSYGSSAQMPDVNQATEDEFVQALLKAFGSTDASETEDISETLSEGLYGRINAKELEILQLVGRGFRNREIGARLGLTEGTVKWYMQQIYDKLGVRRRPQAVERARQFGILS